MEVSACCRQNHTNKVLCCAVYWCCHCPQELLDKRGHFQVPYLEDPNEGVYLFESSAIVKYLEDTYAASS